MFKHCYLKAHLKPSQYMSSCRLVVKHHSMVLIGIKCINYAKLVYQMRLIHSISQMYWTQSTPCQSGLKSHGRPCLIFYLIKRRSHMGLSEWKNPIFLTPSKIDFLSWNITTGLDYGDLGHFWPPRAIWGVWGAYVGFRGACENQIYQFPHETIFGPEMSFFGPN